MSARLRLDLIVKTYPRVMEDAVLGYADRWSWRLWSGSRIVSTSGSQLYSRRIDCARGAEVGAGLDGVGVAVRTGELADTACRWKPFEDCDVVEVRLIDERTP